MGVSNRMIVRMPVSNVDLLLTLTLLGSVIGCGKPADLPALAPVVGKIMMDGKPLAGVLVSFESPSGVVAFGATDENGGYELVYRDPYTGAGLGENTVRIETSLDAPTPGGWRDPIPSIYNARSTLKANVVEGPNAFDFALESKLKKKVTQCECSAPISLIAVILFVSVRGDENEDFQANFRPHERLYAD